MKKNKNELKLFLLSHTTEILFILIFVIFGLFSPRFFTVKNLENILSNGAYIGVIAVGMTLVLITGGVDLSVGANMYVSIAIFDLALNVNQLPLSLSIIFCLLTGTVIGCFNAFLVIKVKIVPFLSTLIGTALFGGVGLFITRSAPLPFTQLSYISSTKVFNIIPVPSFIFLLVLILGTIFLSFTYVGRHLYAVGKDLKGAIKAGLKTNELIASTYIICGFLAGLGAILSIFTLGSAQSQFGKNEEFNAITAAILGGASLYGGVGTIFPGTFLGVIMIQMIQAGLIFMDVDIYFQTMVQSAIIFFAILMDSTKISQIKKIEEKNIMKLVE